MPPYSRSRVSAAKSSVRQWISSLKNKGYNRIICNKCCHKYFNDDKNRFNKMYKHFLECDPSMVQWCSICIVHSTTSDIEMKRHKYKVHPGHSILSKIKYFNTKKIQHGSSCCKVNALSIRWDQLDIDTLYDPSSL